MKESVWPLTLVTNKNDTPIESYLEFVKTCVKAGVSCVQLREKKVSQDCLLQFGLRLKSLLDSFNIPLIINDDVNLCLTLNAAGVHLGQSDCDVIAARAILGPDKRIGLSVNTLQQIHDSKAMPIDYLGLGAIFPTANKPNIETIWGLEGLKKASAIASHPIIAIGGIEHHTLKSVINHGAAGIAAIGAFHNAKDPFTTTQLLLNLIKETSSCSAQ